MNKPVYLGLSSFLNKTKIWRQDKTKLHGYEQLHISRKIGEEKPF